MTLLDSLLDAIVRLEGDALVMHVGEKPYVVTASASMNAYRGPLAWGQVELSSKVLTPEAVQSMLLEILPAGQQTALEEYGAVEHEVVPPVGIADRFTVVAARGGDDIYLELRRRPTDPPESVSFEAAAPTLSSVVGVDSASADIEAAPLHEVAVSAPCATELASSIVAELSGVVEPVVVAPAAPEEHLPDASAKPAFELTSPAPTDSVPGDDSSAFPEQPDPATAAVGTLLLEVEPDEPPAPVALIGDSPEEITDGVPELTSAVDVARAPDDDAPLRAETFEASAGTHQDTAAPADASVEAVPPIVEPAPASAIDEPPAGDAVVVDVAEKPTRPDRSLHTAIWASAMASWASIRSGRAEPSAEPVAPDTAAPDAPDPPRTEPPRAAEAIVPAATTIDDLATPATAFEETDHIVTERSFDTSMAPLMAASSEAAALRYPSAAAPPRASTDAVRRGGHGNDDESEAPVVPLTRTGSRAEEPPASATIESSVLMNTLRTASARGASTVYVVARSKPMLRMDGEFSPVETEAVFTAADVDRLVMDLAPPRRRDAAQNGPLEWMCDVPELGRVRCLTFRDHRGPGVIFRLFPPRAISASQLALSPEVQALCAQSEGLVIVTGGRASGKSTLMNAFVDQINRSRSDYLITIESQIGFVHESRKSFISQRELRGEADAAAAVRAALREDPDVMVIEDMKSPEMVAAALEAAESGRLVFVSIAAASTAAAIEQMIELFPEDRRGRARGSIAATLRGAVSQVLLRRATGGRVVAREVLLNSPAVASLLAEGKTSQLGAALDAGRRHGMVPLTDAIAALVRDGSVHVSEGYRKALDRPALLGVLQRDGVDTSLAERLA